MKKTSYLILVFAVVCIVFFGGQQGRTTRQQSLQPTGAPVAQPQPSVSQPVATPARTSLPPETEAETEIPLLFLGPDDIHFPPQQQGERSTAPRTAVLLGNPRAAGLYVTRTIIPKGKQIIPHIHSDSRTVVVLSGTYYYGIGEEFDAKKLVALPSGSFLTEPAGIPHFTWAKDGDVIVQTTAIGPSGTRIISDKSSQE